MYPRGEDYTGLGCTDFGAFDMEISSVFSFYRMISNLEKLINLGAFQVGVIQTTV